MTITYPNGTVLEAVLLSHEAKEIRATAPGCDDVLVLTRIRGTWISEELEPVAIEFAWQRCGASYVPAEDDCICPNALANHLISTLLTGSELDEAAAYTLYFFNPEGNRVTIQPIDLQLT